MATIILKLDTRRANGKGLFPVKVQISHNSASVNISTGIYVKREHWLGVEINKMIKPTSSNAKVLNEDLERIYFQYSNALRELSINQSIGDVSAVELKKMLTPSQELSLKEVSFNAYFRDYASKRRADKSQVACLQTLKSVETFAGAKLSFKDISVTWLKSFDATMVQKGNSINTRAFHFRNIRAVFNSAIDEDLIGQDLYPFRKFKIRASRKDKESLSVAQLRTMKNTVSDCVTKQTACDLFMLSFYLCGINLVDLYNVKEVYDGKIRFIRQKTSGKNENPIMIKIQPEAQKIIDQYKGEEYLLSFAEHYTSYDNFNNMIQKRIRSLAKDLGFNGMTYYWARYSWATIADSIGIAEKEISKGLGHVDTSLAGRVYISYDWGKVDVANRKVIDCLFDQTKPSE